MLIQVNNLSYSYPRDFFSSSPAVLENIHFEVRSGEFLGVLGENGAGKTTFMDLLAGHKRPTHGSVKINGESAFEMRNKIGYISHDMVLKQDITIAQYLDFHNKHFPKFNETSAKHYLNFFKLDSNTMIGSLSTGFKKKVLSVAVFASNVELILIDEITAVLDPRSRSQFFEVLLDLYKNHGKTIILATNIVEDLKARVEKIFLISDRQGTFHESGSIEHIFGV
jgi:ABC-2 type transport system ATP-binding protein